MRLQRLCGATCAGGMHALFVSGITDAHVIRLVLPEHGLRFRKRHCWCRDDAPEHGAPEYSQCGHLTDWSGGAPGVHRSDELVCKLASIMILSYIDRHTAGNRGSQSLRSSLTWIAGLHAGFLPANATHATPGWNQLPCPNLEWSREKLPPTILAPATFCLPSATGRRCGRDQRL